MQGLCHVWPRFAEFSGVAMSCFALSRSAVFADVSRIKPEDPFNPVFKAILYSLEDVELMPLVFTGIPGGSYCRRLRSLLLCFSLLLSKKAELIVWLKVGSPTDVVLFTPLSKQAEL